MEVMDFADGAVTPSTPASVASFDPSIPSTSTAPSTPGPIGFGSAPPRTPSRLQTPQGGMQQAQNSPFRAQNGGDRVAQLQQQSRRINMTNGWLQDHHQQQYLQRPSRPGSHVGSAISSATSCHTEISLFSIAGLSTLSVDTNVANYPYMYAQNAQMPNALSTVSASSSTENENPNMLRDIESAVEGAVRVLQRENNWERKLEVLRGTLYPLTMTKCRTGGALATEQFAIGHASKKKLLDLVKCLFMQLVPRPNETEHSEAVVSITLTVLYHAATKSRTCRAIIEKHNRDVKRSSNVFGLFPVIVQRVNQMNPRYVNKAWVLLSALLNQTKMRKDAQEDPRICPEIMRFLVEKLRGELESTAKYLAVGALRVIVQERRGGECVARPINFDRQELLATGVIETLTQIMKQEVDEKVLWSTAQTLSVFLTDPLFGELFVKCGGIQALCNILCHPSTRLLHEVLLCLQRTIDLPQTRDQDLAESIEKVMQLLGASDAVIVERATGCLVNVGFHNKKNKETLVECKAPNIMFDVLKMSNNFVRVQEPSPFPHPQHLDPMTQRATQENPDPLRKTVANIYQHCLMILNNLTKYGVDDKEQVAVAARNMISTNLMSPSTFLNFTGMGSVRLRRLSMQILRRVIETVPSYASLFLDSVDNRGESLPKLLILRIGESFEKCSYYIRNKEEAKVNEHDEVVRHAIRLLESLMATNSRFADTVCEAMMVGSNPLTLLRYTVKESMLVEWLRLVAGLLTSSAERAQLMTSFVRADEAAFRFLGYMANDPRYRESAEKLLGLVGRTM
ncbi:unnamed protein product [Caenorhabditis auriculariae]|uniref:Uncharacterized protein n=1 Tax=Caenorhabditis auriculariae TaxID=2777116 RepID=A0A8S1HK19_9PELO|nr:unnamed protein product [Caenorhabditis auriculariae]